MFDSTFGIIFLLLLATTKKESQKMSTKDWISKVSFAKPSCWSFVDFDDHFQRFERLKKLEVHREI